MYTITEHYEEVKVRGTKSGKCQCGKRLTRSASFTQTLNPYNKVDDRPKTRSEIYVELATKKAEWLKESMHCTIPSYWSWGKEQRDEYREKGSTVIEAPCGAKITCAKPV